MAKKKKRLKDVDTAEKRVRRIKEQSWKKYTDTLKNLSDTASDRLKEYILAGHTEQEILDYAYAIVTQYGEASAEMACIMYEALAEYSGAPVAAAEPAAVATYGETANRAGHDAVHKGRSHHCGIGGQACKAGERRHHDEERAPRWSRMGVDPIGRFLRILHYARFERVDKSIRGCDRKRTRYSHT